MGCIGGARVQVCMRTVSPECRGSMHRQMYPRRGLRHCTALVPKSAPGYVEKWAAVTSHSHPSDRNFLPASWTSHSTLPKPLRTA